MTTTNLNVAPYYDDFDVTKGHQQILFKPGYAVQARELTQIQTILRDQISKFGHHIFKHGSVVIPGNITSDLALCHVKLTTSPTFDSEQLIDTTVSSTTGLQGRIRAYTSAAGADPFTIYVSYLNSGTNSEQVFGPSETLTVTTALGLVYTFETAAVSPVGAAALAFINDGVFFIHGTFAQVNKQSIVIAKYTNVPNCSVLLKITEEIVSSTDDNTLLDPATGSNNYAAPGADRIKLTLTLVSLPAGEPITDNYVELMRFNAGVLEFNSKYAKYNELEKNLARRTADESGDYIANGLQISLHESLKKQFNGGKVVGGSVDDYAISVQPGKAYIDGFEAEVPSERILTVPKGRGLTPNHIKNKQISTVANYGQYFYVTNLKSLPNFKDQQTVDLYNSESVDVATLIGQASVIGIDLFESNSTDATNIYKLYVTGITATGNLSTLGSVRFTGSAVGSADVVHKMTVTVSGADFIQNEIISYLSNVGTVVKWNRSSSILYVKKHTTANLPSVGFTITGGTSGATGVIKSSEYIKTNQVGSSIFQISEEAVYKIKQNIGTDASPVYASNISYKVYKEISIVLAAGTGSFTISDGTIDPIEIGNTIVTSATANLSISTLSLSVNGQTITYTGAGADGAVIKIICAVTKSANSNKSKALATHTESGLARASTILLQKADIYKLVSVISSTEGDVTSRYGFSTGQTDYSYALGSVILQGIQPASGTLSVTYEYFSHSGTGDFFSIDSYVSSGLTDYYGSVGRYISASDGVVYDLTNCLDFRPKFDDVPSKVDQIVIDSRITTDVQFYVGRYDSILLEKNGNLSVNVGTPAISPSYPPVKNGSINLGTIYVPPYTFKISDMKIYPSELKGYKMSDILAIENRILNLEQYSLLSNTENNLINNSIVDANTGLSRYKSGYLVENFFDHTKIADVQNVDFKATYVNGELQPAMERYVIDLDINTTTGVVTSNSTVYDPVITLPYTTAIFTEQVTSSRITNVNPFMVFSWQADLSIVPLVDNFVNFNILPKINTVINNVVVTTTTIDVPRPWDWVAELPAQDPVPVIIAPPPPITPPSVVIPVLPPPIQLAPTTIGGFMTTYDRSGNRHAIWDYGTGRFGEWIPGEAPRFPPLQR